MWDPAAAQPMHLQCVIMPLPNLRRAAAMVGVSGGRFNPPAAGDGPATAGAGGTGRRPHRHPTAVCLSVAVSRQAMPDAR